MSFPLARANSFIIGLQIYFIRISSLVKNVTYRQCLSIKSTKNEDLFLKQYYFKHFKQFVQ